MAIYTPETEDTRLYECAVLYPYPFSQKEESDLLKQVEELFAEAGAKQVAKDLWGRRGLAYRIGGFDEGNFAIYHWDMDPAKVKEVDQQLKILKGVLRHMIVKPPEGYHIVKFSEEYVKWQERAKVEEEDRAREKEERLKKRMVEKAKRTSAKPEAPRKAAPAGEAKSKDFTTQIDKLISTDQIDL